MCHKLICTSANENRGPTNCFVFQPTVDGVDGVLTAAAQSRVAAAPRPGLVCATAPLPPTVVAHALAPARTHRPATHTPALVSAFFPSFSLSLI